MPHIKLFFDVMPTSSEPFNTSMTVMDHITIGELVGKVSNKFNVKEPMVLISSLGRPLDISSTLAELNFDFDKEKLAFIPQSAKEEPFPEDVIQKTTIDEGVPKWEDIYPKDLDITHVYNIFKKGPQPTVECTGGKTLDGSPFLVSHAIQHRHPEYNTTFEEAMICSAFSWNYLCNNNLRAKTAVTIMDCKNLGYSDYSSFETNVLNWLTRVSSNKKPIVKCYFVNTPWIFRTVMRIASKFLDPEVRAKFETVGDPSTGALDHAIDRDQLPPYWGGKSEPADAWLDRMLHEQGFTKDDLDKKPFPGGRPFLKELFDSMGIDEDETLLAYDLQVEQAIHSGVMTKQGYTVKNWKTFEFLLVPTGPMLYYYKTVNDAKPAGKINLSYASKVVDNGGDSFDIVCLTRTYYIKVSEDEKEDWLKHINDQIKIAKEARGDLQGKYDKSADIVADEPADDVADDVDKATDDATKDDVDKVADDVAKVSVSE